MFIVGAARSGTTLLRNLLCAHPRVIISHETHFMKFAQHWAATRADRPENREAFWSALARHLQPRAFFVDLARCRDLVAEAGSWDFRTVFAAMLAADAEKSGKMRAGEKTPGHERYLDCLLQWFPDATVVFMRRDPRACVASALQAPWVREQTHPRRLVTGPMLRRLRLVHVALKAQEWLESWRAEQRFSADPRVTVVRYGELVRDPEQQLRRLCDFLGEEWDPCMLSNTTAQNSEPSRADLRWRDWVLAHQQRAASAVSSDSVARWRQDLSETEIAVVEEMCSVPMARMGLAPNTSVRRRRWAHAWVRALLGADAAERMLRRTLKRAVLTNTAATHFRSEAGPAAPPTVQI